MALPFADISTPPEKVSSGTVLARMVEGLGFRYRWATEGLREADLEFAPSVECMPLRKLLEHVLGLVTFADAGFGGPKSDGLPAPRDVDGLRTATLARLDALRTRALAMSDADLAACRIDGKGEKLPFWYLINGPLADALTHVGQINSWRRLAGNPWPGANVFMGKPTA